ncbi:MAG: aminoacyl-tRNA hydrolase [Bacteroidia bacterium]|nr:aminoacyl-tRNA hydrolase [Bacteroidia bacterium]
MHFIPPFLDSEFSVKTSRSSGKGGQHVNKTSTKVLLGFSVHDSLLLTADEKTILLEKLAHKLTNNGLLQVVAQAERSQLGNREIAVKKMYALLNKCFVVRKKRKATKPTKTATEKRLTAKKRRGLHKKERTLFLKNE